MERLSRWLTSRRRLLLALEHLIGNPVSDMLLTFVIRAMALILGAVFWVLEVVFRVSAEDIIIRFFKLPRVRETTLRAMAKMKPVMEGLEPELLCVIREALRVRGVKDVILPLMLSTGLIFEAIGDPEVISRLGRGRED